MISNQTYLADVRTSAAVEHDDSEKRVELPRDATPSLEQDVPDSGKLDVLDSDKRVVKTPEPTCVAEQTVEENRKTRADARTVMLVAANRRRVVDRSVH